MKKVFLYAYDRQNLGDDLFVQFITKRYPNVQFYIWTKKNNIKTYSKIENLSVIDSESLKIRLLGIIRPSFVSRYKHKCENKCDAVVYIGGSIFIEYSNWREILNWWEYEASNFQFFALGANFGPYKTEEYLNGHKRLFKNMKDVCFREKFSWQLFKDVDSVRYAPDILFAQQMPKRNCCANKVVISLIDCIEKSEGVNKFSKGFDVYFQSMLNIAKGYTNDGFSVLLMSFCKSEGDEKIAERLKTELNEDEQIETLYYNGMNSFEMLQAIADSDYVIASRFHAVILSIIARKPVYPFIYSDKTKNVLDDIGFLNEYEDIRTMSMIEYKDCKKVFEEYYFDDNKVKMLRRDSERQFAVLDEILRH